MKRWKIAMLSLFAAGVYSLGFAQDPDSLSRESTVVRIESENEKDIEFESSCPKSDVSPGDTVNMDIGSECPDLKGFSSDMTINEMKKTPGDVEIMYSTDSTEYTFKREGSEVKETYVSPEEFARLKENGKKGKKSVDYESYEGEYEYKKDRDDEKESYRGSGKNWEIEKDN